MSIKTVGIAMGVGAGIAGAYKAGEISYEQSLKQRMPEGGLEESIFPYMKVASEVCNQAGLGVEFMGGPVKQSLCDPETEILDHAKQVLVSTNPGCRTIKKATLYRPNFTVRDLDLLVSTIGDKPALPEYKAELAEHAGAIQAELNHEARARGFLRGPEVSLFGYEPDYGSFKVSHYATRTHYRDGGNQMTHSLGASEEFEDQDKWDFIVNTEEGRLAVPTAAPVRVLGRTLTRSLVSRQRDIDEVYEAIENLESKGLGETVLGTQWSKYQSLRNELDSTFSFAGKIGRLKVSSLANLALAKALAPLAPKIEDSYIADMMQDPESPIFRLAAKLMGANEVGEKHES